MSVTTATSTSTLPLPPGVHRNRLKWLKGGDSHALIVPPNRAALSSAPSPSSYSPSAAPQCVVYWMQRSVRSTLNHALEMSIHHANNLGLPLIVVFAIVTSYPGANERGFAFLFEGLSEVQSLLAKRGIRMVVREAKPKGSGDGAGAAADSAAAAASTAVPDVVLDTCRRLNAPLLIMDRAYERLLRTWRDIVCTCINCPVLLVESDVVVPVEAASPRPLASAAALRRAHAPLLAQYLQPLPELVLTHPSVDLPCFAPSIHPNSSASLSMKATPNPSSLPPPTSLPPSPSTTTFAFDELDLSDPHALLSSLSGIDRSVPRITFKRGGPTQAKLHLARFLRDRLEGYQNKRKEAGERHQSFLSPYLHFGHISPLYVVEKVKKHTRSSAEDRRRFVDELVTWREMACHFVWWNREGYDRWEGAVPRWARETLLEGWRQAGGGREEEGEGAGGASGGSGASVLARDGGGGGGGGGRGAGGGGGRTHAYSLEELEEGRTHDVLWNAAQMEMRVTGYMHNYLRMFW